MKIDKLTFSRTALETLSKNQLTAFLSLGLFLNEMNWLQKIALIASKDRADNEADQAGRLSLSIMIAKIMAAKLNQGWNRIDNQLKKELDALPTNKKIESLRSHLEQKLAKDSTVHKIRANHASHYPLELSLNGLPDISEEEIAIYMTGNLGDVLTAVSDLSSVAELLKSTAGSTKVSRKDLDNTLDEIYSAAKTYSEYIAEVLDVFVKEVLKTKGKSICIENIEALDLNSIKLPFFMNL